MTGEASGGPGFDPGLQPERTTLSWTRMSLALLVVAALVLRWIDTLGAAALLLVSGFAALACGLMAAQRRRYRAARGAIASGAPRPPLASIAAMTAGEILLGLAALAIVVGHEVL